MAKRKYQVIIAPEARDDLWKELEYIRRKGSVEGAKLVNEGILDEIGKLASFPGRHPILHRISSDERTYRFVPKWAYLVIFRVEEKIKRVRVVSIFAARQDPEKIEEIVGR
ncbi:MAG: type II toxin-antitoxin system RelE/ParE family toxin [Phaeodactylibacter sp.]|nr:type II toxin-antitoxin system RelE/ParE family toxin [Phaeodactylibacter sp.]